MWSDNEFRMMLWTLAIFCIVVGASVTAFIAWLIP